MKTWGTSRSNFYTAGLNGGIAHYNGSSWSLMTSNTTCDLDDIYGIDANNIWAIGTMDDYSRSVVLRFDGKSWKTIYDDALMSPSNQYQFSAGWTIDGKNLYVAGISGTGIMDAETGNYKKSITPATFLMYDINATTIADIFTTGFGEVVHYNGWTWYLYPEIKAINDGFVTGTELNPYKILY